MKANTLKLSFSKLSAPEQLDVLDYCYSLVHKADDPTEACNNVKTAGGCVCPSCKIHATRYGKTASGQQRYYCKKCKKTFVMTACTPISRTKKNSTVWRKYFECFVGQKSLRTTAKDCGISLPTAFLWRHKILDCLEQSNRTIKVEGTIQMDETFINDSYKGNYHHKIELPRLARKHGKHAQKRGLSREKLCIPCAVDSAGHQVAIVANRGKTSVKALYAAYGNRIALNSDICSDSEKSYRILANRNSCTLHAMPSGATTHKGYNIQRVNALHSEIEKMRVMTKNVASKYLNGYLAFCCWKYGKSNLSTSELVCSLMNSVFQQSTKTTWENVSCRKAIPILV